MVFQMINKMVRFEERKKLCNESGSTGKPEDIVDVLLSSTLADSKTPLPDDICVLLLMDILIGGTDTTATAIEWTFGELLRHPDQMRRLRDELYSAFGPNQLVKEDALDSLPYLNAVVKESFRHHPPIPSGGLRESIKAFQLQGYTVPQGSRISVNQWAIHRDPAVFYQTEEFKPERFLEGPEINILIGTVPAGSIRCWKTELCGVSIGTADNSFGGCPCGSQRRHCFGRGSRPQGHVRILWCL